MTTIRFIRLLVTAAGAAAMIASGACSDSTCPQPRSPDSTSKLPVAAFSGTPTSGDLPLAVQFTDGSTGATSWYWDFGDGDSSTAQDPLHTYENADSYTVALTATNAVGSDTTTVTDYIVVTGARSYSYNIVQQFPHDPAAFTQGLVYVDTVFIEGTGLLGESTLRRVVPATGLVIQNHDLPSNWFGEGVAVWGDTIVQLTWLNNIAIVYDKETFAEIDTLTYPTQGWGLTHDGTRFIMSDGTSRLYFRDRNTFAEIGRVTVFDDRGPVNNLNELEYIDGYVYANRWQTQTILMIDPATGRVRGRINASGLEHTSSNVTNGIAYDAVGDRLFITGKRWQNVYEIELVELPPG